MDDFIEKYNEYKINYNKEQEEFIEFPLENCKLLGIPGGGKTQSIIGKIIYHYKNGDFKKNNEFMILTFSRRACNDFIQKGKKQNKKYFTIKNIKTIHSLAGKIVYKALDKKSSSQDTVIISSIDIIQNYKDNILELDELQNLKVIFVDEAQDISYIQYQFILKISEITNCSIIMIGDPNQNIYQFQNGSDKFLLNHEGKTFQLIYNYRSTPFIVDFVNEFRPWNSLTTKMISVKDEKDIYNKKPILFIGTVDEIIHNIIYKIKNSPFPKEEIAIIGPVKKSKPVNDSYTNIGLSIFTNLLNQHNIKYVKHYEDINNENEIYDNVKKEEDHINLFTIHGSKGLEFQQVFLINFHTSTFGMNPTEEKYKEFKYLWYVGLSRAIYDLHIYIDKSKNPWNELKNVNKNLYNIENDIQPYFKELKFNEEIIPFYHSVTEIINSKKYLNDELLYHLENTFKYKITEIKIFDDINEKYYISNYKDYCVLYGIFIENIFNYFYCKKRNRLSDFIIKLNKIINLEIIVPKEYIIGYKILKIRCPFIKDIIKLNDFSEIKNQFRKQEEDLYSYLCNIMDNDYHREFYLNIENYVIRYSKNDLLNYCDILSDFNNDDNKYLYLIIFKITIFYYQLSNETGYIWDIDFTQELIDLEPFINNVIHYAENLEEEFDFHPVFRHPKLDIVGELDLYHSKKIVDIKFSNHLNMKHIIQVLIYNNIVDVGFKNNFEIEIWNFYMGSKYVIELDKENTSIFLLLTILSKSIHKKIENMIIMYDLETTGLCYSGKKVDIIERHFEEYTTGIQFSSGFIKPVYVPFIPYEITSLTGITKEMVYENGSSFLDFKNEMDILLKYCNKPIFIAHNGNSFDHKILVERNILNYDKCILLDSKVIIRLFLNDPITNKSLSEIFKFLFGFIPTVHRAMSDVKMLISIFEKLNITYEKILKFKK